MILHRDISLFNLLLALWDGSDRLEFLDVLPEDIRGPLRERIKKDVSYRGLFADWGYAVPIESPSSQPTTQPTTPDSGDDPIEGAVDLARLTCGEGAVPAQLRNSEKDKGNISQYVPISKLGIQHEIKLQMAGEPVDSERPSIDNDPLCRTVRLIYCLYFP